MSSIEGILRGGKFKRILEKTMMAAKQQTNLNRIELEVIYLLFHYDDIQTMTDICQYTQMNKGHVSTTLDSLVKKGYLVCERDEKDRRFVKYSLAESSEQLCNEMERLWSDLMADIVDGVDAHSLEIFKQVSEQIDRNLDRLLEERI